MYEWVADYVAEAITAALTPVEVNAPSDNTVTDVPAARWTRVKVGQGTSTNRAIIRLDLDNEDGAIVDVLGSQNTGFAPTIGHQKEWGDYSGLTATPAVLGDLGTVFDAVAFPITLNITPTYELDGDEDTFTVNGTYANIGELAPAFIGAFSAALGADGTYMGQNGTPDEPYTDHVRGTAYGATFITTATGATKSLSIVDGGTDGTLGADPLGLETMTPTPGMDTTSLLWFGPDLTEYGSGDGDGVAFQPFGSAQTHLHPATQPQHLRNARFVKVGEPGTGFFMTIAWPGQILPGNMPFTPEDGTWSVGFVDGALNDLRDDVTP